MHISEGILSGPVLITGGVLAATGTAIGLKTMDYEQIARSGILAASFFVVSLIHFPLGPASAHLIMSGLMGVLLGWGAFPVILVALLLQSILFQYGGLTTIGVNTIIMAGPAVICGYIFRPFIDKKKPFDSIASFACGFLGVFMGTGLFWTALIRTETNLVEAATIAAVSQIPVMILEGVVTLFCVAFLKKVYPEIFMKAK